MAYNPAGTMGTLRRYLDDSRAWETAVAAAVPLFVVYELGLLLFTSGEVRNAADVYFKVLLGIQGGRGLLVLNSVVLLLFLGATVWRRRRPALRLLPLVAVEGACYALILAPATLVLCRLVTLSAGGAGGGRAEELVLGVGAGLYEELVFRLILVAGGFALLRRLAGLDPVWAAVLVLIVSSLAFSAFHHVGTVAEPWSARVFVFRFLAGVLLGMLFLLRGFGVVSWTHALYDVFLTLGPV